jgi:hypothetical protein
MRRATGLVATLFVLVALAFVVQRVARPQTPVGPAQPIAFSHKLHAGQYAIDCLYCHTGTDASPVAVVPPVEVCMGCHRVVAVQKPEVQKLAGYAARGEPIPWVQVNRLAEFVQFNHGAHVRAGVACQECHGPVEEMDTVYAYATLRMGWCLACHTQPAPPETAAAVARRAAAWAPGREPKGLYPRVIDVQYGLTRGPIDCVACHY